MALNRAWTALEALGVAIRSEIEAASLYARLAAQVQNPSLVAKLTFLQQEEEKHRTMLEGLYHNQFPEVALELPAKSLVPVIGTANITKMAVPELFQLAMRAEESSAEFYEQEADRSRDEKGRALLRYLSNVERGHYQMLETEYDLLSRFPDYYDADEFHFGDELMHIGP
jgi:rubrerythrin